MSLLQPALITFITVSFGLLASGAAAAASAEERLDRNLEASEVPGPTVPAVPTSALEVSKGSVKVRIGDRQYRLETLTVVPRGDGPFPLAVVSHGTPARGGRAALRNLRIRQLLPIAEDFARRGYKAVAFARRGHATSSGQFQEGFGRCKYASKASYVRFAREGAKDYAAIIEALAAEPDVDGSTVVAAGHSGGGFAALALASEPPPGLGAVINFAGGRGGQEDGGNCSEAGFVDAHGEFGRAARVPALWLYSTTDPRFRPELVDKALAAYARGGAPVRLDRVGALWFTGNGHLIHLLGGREYWRPRIDGFLDAIGAPSWERAPDDAAIARAPSPAELGERGGRGWRLYLGTTGHKAFALGEGLEFGWSALRATRAEAVAAAMRDCEKRGGACRIVSIDGETVPR